MFPAYSRLILILKTYFKKISIIMRIVRIIIAFLIFVMMAMYAVFSLIRGKINLNNLKIFNL